MLYRTHGWERVREYFAEVEQYRPDLQPMWELVERLAASHYAVGLHPVQSMWTLLLYQVPEYDPQREPRICVEYDPGSSEFVVQYHAGPYEQPFSTQPLESHWVKRHPDGIAGLERCFKHLRWFSEYRSGARM